MRFCYLHILIKFKLTPNSIDDLRMAVKEIICDSETERRKYEEAVIAITVEQSLKRLGPFNFLVRFEGMNWI